MTRIDQAVDLITQHGPMTYDDAAAHLGVTMRSMENAFRQAAMQGRLVCLRRGSAGFGIKALYGLPDADGSGSVTKAARSYIDQIAALLAKMGTITSADVAEHLGVSKRQASDAIITARRNGLLTRIGKEGQSAIYGPVSAPRAAAKQKCPAPTALGSIPYGGYIGAAPARAPWLDWRDWPESSAPLVSRARGGEGVV